MSDKLQFVRSLIPTQLEATNFSLSDIQSAVVASLCRRTPNRTAFTQKLNRTCNWNILGGSMFANAGIPLVAVPTPPTN